MLNCLDSIDEEPQALLEHFKAGEGAVVSVNKAHKSVAIRFDFSVENVIDPVTGNVITKGIRYTVLKYEKPFTLSL